MNDLRPGTLGLDAIAACRIAACEAADKLSERTYLHPDRAFQLGQARHALDALDAACFEALNVLYAHLDDAEAERLIDAHHERLRARERSRTHGPSEIRVAVGA